MYIVYMSEFDVSKICSFSIIELVGFHTNRCDNCQNEFTFKDKYALHINYIEAGVEIRDSDLFLGNPLFTCPHCNMNSQVPLLTETIEKAERIAVNLARELTIGNPKLVQVVKCKFIELTSKPNNTLN